MITLKRIAVVVVCCAALASCGHKAEKSDPRPTVTVSIEPQRYILDKIAGDKINVVTFMPAGANPENFDPPMSVMKSVSESDAYFRIGRLAFEDAVVEKVLESHPSIMSVDTSAGIKLLEGTHMHYDEDHHHGHDHAHGDVDPHVWSSVKNAVIIGRNMYEAVVKLDPDNKEYYAENFRRFSTHLDSLDRAISDMLADKQGASFMVWHPSLSYFARDYGLKQVSLGSENKEMSVKSLSSKIDDARQYETSIFFTQSDIDEGKASPVLQQTDAKSVAINLLDYDWEGQLIKIATEIAENGAENK
ncbi:MAG: zinc ABC transporter substrate-binding protein [Muribaculaceae bacterium]|nr:zinc ABC transporter substrate-binding protein [Muribaculaceae bacterium]